MRSKNERVVIGLIVTLLVMCLGMVILGGYVRLSGSGLSIPEWPFFTIKEEVQADGAVVRVRSVFPPTSDAGWQTLYATLIRELPQFDGISMGEFKRMFWIEWSHRGLAKIIGVVYLAFMAFVLADGGMRRRLGWLAGAGLVLLASQAVLGGLVVLTHLVAFKVALHLVFAFVFTAVLLWGLMLLWHEPIPAAERAGANPIRMWAFVITLLVTLQVFSGGLMAGSLAGYQMNTWPKMGEVWVPAGLHAQGMGFFRNFTENVVMIQFFHRWFAFAMAVAILLFVFRCMTVEVTRTARWGLRVLFSLVILQIVLGIYTLLTGVHVHLALTHQFVGLLLVLNCVVVLYEVSQHRVLLEEALAEREEKSRPAGSMDGKAALNA